MLSKKEGKVTASCTIGGENRKGKKGKWRKTGDCLKDILFGYNGSRREIPYREKLQGRGCRINSKKEVSALGMVSKRDVSGEKRKELLAVMKNLKKGLREGRETEHGNVEVGRIGARLGGSQKK